MHTFSVRRGWTAFAIAVLSMAAASQVLFAQSTPLRLVSTAWPPFTNEPGQPRFALDLVEAALGRIGLSSKTTIVDAEQFTPALLGDEFDGSAAAWKDAERERVLVFSQPYLENRLVLVGRKGSDVSAATLGALKGKRIAIVGGYSYGNAIDEAASTYLRSRSEEDSVKLLLGGSVDYALMDELVVQYLVTNYAKEAETKLELGSTPLLTRQLHLAIKRSRPDAESIVTRFNAQLRGMIADRTYHRLLHVAWILADVDGDGIPEYCTAERSPGTSAAEERVRSVFHATAHAPAVAATLHEHAAAFLCRRQHLHRLGDNSQPVQDRRCQAPRSEPVDREHLPILVVMRQSGTE